MKPRPVLSLVLVLLVIAGAAAVLTGCVQQPAHQEQTPAPVATLPALSILSGQGGDPGEVAERIARSTDYQDPVVKQFVTTHTRPTGGAPTIAQVSDVWEAISANWTFVMGPQDSSMYTPASVSITDGMKGNCLDYSILNAAVIESLGGTPRVVIAYNPTDGGHAYPELYIGDSMADLQAIGTYITTRYHATNVYWHTARGPDGKTGYWLNLDWQAKYPGGPIFPDNGTYYASYLTGTGERYFDNGTLVPDFP